METLARRYGAPIGKLFDIVHYGGTIPCLPGIAAKLVLDILSRYLGK